MADCGLDALLAELNLEPVALTDRQRDVIKQWKSYAADLIVYCEELLDYGIGTEEPKKPKISVDTVMKDGRYKQKDLTGDNLHQYLLQYIVEKQSPVLVDWRRNATTCSSESSKAWICLLTTTELFGFVHSYRIWLLVECGL